MARTATKYRAMIARSTALSDIIRSVGIFSRVLSVRPTAALWNRKHPALMKSEQDLHQTMRNQFMQREQFAIGARYCLGVARVSYRPARLQRSRSFLDDRIGHHLSGHLPKCNESVHRRGEAHFEDAKLAGS